MSGYPIKCEGALKFFNISAAAVKSCSLAISDEYPTGVHRGRKPRTAADAVKRILCFGLPDMSDHEYGVSQCPRCPTGQRDSGTTSQRS